MDLSSPISTVIPFLEAAQVNDEYDFFSAAVSNAVTSGINAKDAICLKLTGRTGRADDHTAAAAG